MLNKKEIANSVSRTFHKAAFTLKKHSPEILVVTGVVGVVGSAVMACKATLKVDEVSAKAKDKLDRIHEAKEHGATAVGKEYTEEDYKKDLTIAYVQTAVDYAKLYAPSVVLGTLSITAILAGHNITRQRNVALAAAYTAVDRSFKEYRGRVVERFGEALDKELRYNIQTKEVEEVVVNEDGTESVITKTVEVAGPTEYSDYARFFDDGCIGWTKNPEYNLMFLKDQQRYANDMLQSKRVVTLNEVYDLLGIPRTKAGQQVGWVYDPKNPKHKGDNFIDFGLTDIHRPKTRDFVNGYERVVIVDFNVDGDVLYAFDVE